MSSDWEDYCASRGQANNEQTYERFIDSLSPRAQKTHVSKAKYEVALKAAFQRGKNLVTENHVFKSFKEAAKAAQVLSKQKQSTVEILKTVIPAISQLPHEVLYLVYEPEMKEAIRLVEDYKYLFYPEHPLIKPREKDLLYRENCGDWHFVAHPDGSTKNVKQELHSYVINKYSPEVFSCQIGGTDIDGEMTRQRDEILNMALEQAKSHQTIVYVTREDDTNEAGEHSSTFYMIFTEKQLKEALLSSVGDDVPF